MNDTLRHTIDTELAVTQRADRGASILVIHRVTCRLKAPRTPLALINAQQRWSEAKPCTTCQPSARQLSELESYIADRLALERGVAQLEPCADDAEIIGRALGSVAATVIHDHRDSETGEIVVDSVQRWDRDDLSEQQRKLLQLRESNEIDAFLAVAPKRVREIAQGADVVPLTRKGKHNVRRNAKHDQRDVQPRAAAAPTGETKRCADCQKDVKLTSFPTSTKGGQIVRLDYCRPCRSIRAAAKAGK